MALGMWTLWAVLAATAASFALGFAWYGPLFGERFARYTGMDDLTEEEVEQARREATPGYVVSLLGTAAGALVVAVLFTWSHPGAGLRPPWLLGVALGVAGWGAFYVPGTLTAVFFEDRSLGLWAIGAGYWGLVAAASGFLVGLLHPAG